jgi:glutamyl-tRNA reductase
VVWRTCVREIALTESRAAIPPGATVLDGEAAYAHLLEVICGLDSPMRGETEVLHQFKLFVAGLPAEHHGLREVGRQLLADARSVRGRHLIGLGSRSYGSAVRRYLVNAPRVALAGTGLLAKEIAPFLEGRGRAVDVWGRRERCEGLPGFVTYRRFDGADDPAGEDPTAIVIAAPMASADIARLAAKYRSVSVVIDLRAEGAHDPPPPVAPIVTLADVFASVQAAARTTDDRVETAKDEIRRHARAFATRARLNPSGWHDLCA